MESQLPDQILNQATAVKAWNPYHPATRSSRYSLKPHEQSCLVQGPLFFWLSLSDVISPRALFIIHVAWRTLNFVVRAWSHSRASGWVPPTPARSPQSKALESDMLQQNSQLPTHTCSSWVLPENNQHHLPLGQHHTAGVLLLVSPAPAPCPSPWPRLPSSVTCLIAKPPAFQSVVYTTARIIFQERKSIYSCHIPSKKENSPSMSPHLLLQRWSP